MYTTIKHFCQCVSVLFHEALRSNLDHQTLLEEPEQQHIVQTYIHTKLTVHSSLCKSTVIPTFTVFFDIFV